MARVDTSNLHKAAAGVASAYEGVRETTQSKAGAIAGGLANAINAGIEGYKTGKELEKNALDIEHGKLQNEYQQTQNEILTKSKDPMIQANVAKAKADQAQAQYQENLANKSNTMLDYAEHQSRKSDKGLNNFISAREAVAKSAQTPVTPTQTTFNPNPNTKSPFSTTSAPLSQGTNLLKNHAQPSVFLRQ